MKRRTLVAGLMCGSVAAVGTGYLWRDKELLGEQDSPAIEPMALLDRESPLPVQTMGSVREVDTGLEIDTHLEDGVADSAAGTAKAGQTTGVNLLASEVTMADRVKHFDLDFREDLFLPSEEQALLESVLLRLKRAQKVVGHGKFNVLDFDSLLVFADSYSSIGRFTPKELEFIEKMFSTRASDYGFFGRKVTDQLTAHIREKDIVKVPYSGHYLFKGESLQYYDKLKKDIGDQVILTSGIRSNVKQLFLFLAKASTTGYNLSRASRSLAPPGHSYHGIGDFDVGRVGWGHANFTDRFADTDEFKRMQDLGYVQIRYTEDNRLGVRFEPWHIKVV